MDTIETFIKACANTLKDPTFIVVRQIDWLDILNSQINDLFPDIAILHNTTIAVSTLNSSTMQIDMSAVDPLTLLPLYPNITGIKNIYKIDSDGATTMFTNWTFDKDISLLKLNTKDTDETVGSGESIKIVWFGEMSTKTSYVELIELNNAQTQLLKKACLKEVITRILMDRMKLDRYKTLVGNANEYVLMALQKTFSDEVDFAKRRKNNTNPVRSF
ncbi:hypothetical protein [Methanoculleus sp.]|uniref:hypothetical protein n=1 Tax=Methanoculleus sp. TaxID=90427 RepID=UPI0025F9F3F1|nr:hypothetical protein [Methanoculleus sp.]MCK9319921.1 hypothetical protein [Methanoculleus sp.]